MSAAYRDLLESMPNRSDAELYDILYGHRDEYTEDAIRAAEEEFRRRELPPSVVRNLECAAAARRQEEDAPLPWHLRLFAFFGCTSLAGIPAIIAHRRYVEQGARRKAREFARWSLYGLGFYAAVIAILALQELLSRYRP